MKYKPEPDELFEAHPSKNTQACEHLARELERLTRERERLDERILVLRSHLMVMRNGVV
jgi:hypothetical protein